MTPKEQSRLGDNPTKRLNEEVLARVVPFVKNELVHGVTWSTFIRDNRVYFATHREALLTLTNQFATLLSLGVGENERHADNIYVVFESNPNNIIIVQRDFEYAVDILHAGEEGKQGSAPFGLQNPDGTPIVLYPGRLTDPQSLAASWYDHLYAEHVKTLAYALAVAKSATTGGGMYASLYHQVQGASNLEHMMLALGAVDGSGHGV